jgi:hypothetical protein
MLLAKTFNTRTSVVVEWRAVEVFKRFTTTTPSLQHVYVPQITI